MSTYNRSDLQNTRISTGDAQKSPPITRVCPLPKKIGLYIQILVEELTRIGFNDVNIALANIVKTMDTIASTQLNYANSLIHGHAQQRGLMNE